MSTAALTSSTMVNCSKIPPIFFHLTMNTHPEVPHESSCSVKIVEVLLPAMMNSSKEILPGDSIQTLTSVSPSTLSGAIITGQPIGQFYALTL